MSRWLSRRAATANRKRGGPAEPSYPIRRQHINENKEPNHNESAGRGDAQCGSRHGMSELGAEPGAAAEACCEDHAQRQIKLAVNYITGGRSKRDWKLKDLTQTDTGEDAKPHSKKDRHQQQRSTCSRQ